MTTEKLQEMEKRVYSSRLRTSGSVQARDKFDKTGFLKISQEIQKQIEMRDADTSATSRK